MLVLCDLLSNYYYRGALAFLCSLFIMLLCGNKVIELLQKLSFGQVVRNCGPESHLSKQGTPTMGGVLLISAIVASVLLFCNLKDANVWIALFAVVTHALIGFADDFLKIVRKNPNGLIAKWKYFWQSVCAFVISVCLIYVNPDASSVFNLPFYGVVFIPFMPLVITFFLGYFVTVGSSNAVNLTDGLDGLAAGVTIIVSIALAIAIVCCIEPSSVSHMHLVELEKISSAREMFVTCAAITGACTGFMWFNSYPARVFMGDVGALALGAILGVISLIVKLEFFLFIIGGIYVLETVSVILQVGSYKLRNGKRIFKMAPIHHHFEKSGWHETTVVNRFIIITVILAFIGIASLLKLW